MITLWDFWKFPSCAYELNRLKSVQYTMKSHMATCRLSLLTKKHSSVSISQCDSWLRTHFSAWSVMNRASHPWRAWGYWSTAGWAWASMSPGGQEGLWHPGLCQQYCCQQDQGSDNLMLLSCETFPCPVWSWWTCSSSPLFSFWPLTTRNALRCWNGFREGQQSWWRLCSTNLMRSCWGSWGCLAQRKGGSGEIRSLYTKNKVSFSNKWHNDSLLWGLWDTETSCLRSCGSLEVSETRLDGALNKGKMSLPMAVGLELDNL